jgi:hypothetical protein
MDCKQECKKITILSFVLTLCVNIIKLVGQQPFTDFWNSITLKSRERVPAPHYCTTRQPRLDTLALQATRRSEVQDCRVLAVRQAYRDN